MKTVFPSDAMGMRLKAKTDVPMFKRFPNSEDIKTLIPGEPSREIVGYLPSGFWQLKGETAGVNWYVKDTEKVQVVPFDAPDESGILDSVFTPVADWIGNAGRDVKKTSGFLADGFDKATDDFSNDLFSFSGNIKSLLVIVSVILGLIVLRNLTE